MLDWRFLRRIDLRVVMIVLIFMIISLITISSYTNKFLNQEEIFLTPLVKTQIQWFSIGWVIFIFFVAFDYNKLREYAWFIYLVTILALFGLFFTTPIQNVHRWYRLPILNCELQPSELAKIAVITTMSWFLERRATSSTDLSTAIGALLIAAIPFCLIYKQPDLGTAIVLIPMTLVMCYFGNINTFFIKLACFLCFSMLLIVSLFFTGIISHDDAKPYFLSVLKEYQYERLNPNTYHQKASATAIAIGGISGVGWRNSEYSKGGSLPTPYTDSVFPAFGEEFGLVGLFFVLVLFYALLYCGFQVTVVAKDAFGRLLAAGITLYIAVHVIVNISMMCGFLPITGVPLPLMSYGGSSILITMMAIGILQSIYSRRFMF